MKAKTIELTKYATIANGEIYYGYGNSEEKEIDGIKYIQVTPDFNRAVFIRRDTIRKAGTHTIDVSN
jgi:hypothetical protein